MFANSSYETSTDTEKAFNKAFVAQLGNIALIVTLVVGAAFVTILMIVGNTMALTIRERTREIGVLKTLGFTGRRILGMVLGESVLLALLGGVPGLLLAALFAFILRENLSNFVPGFAMTPGIAVTGADRLARPGHRDHSGAQRHAAADRRRARTRLTMRSLLLQVIAVTTINLKSIAQRLWLSLSTVVAVALVVIVLLAFLAMANGFQRTLAGTGSDDIAISSASGSPAEINSMVAARPGAADRGRAWVARGSDGKPLSRPSSISRSTASSAPVRPRPTCRCVVSARAGAAIRKGIKLIARAGCSIAAPTRLVVGKATVEGVPGFELGKTVVRAQPLDRGRHLRGRRQRVRIWRSGPICRWCRACSTGRLVQTVRMRLESPRARGAQELTTTTIRA